MNPVKFLGGIKGEKTMNQKIKMIANGLLAMMVALLLVTCSSPEGVTTILKYSLGKDYKAA